MSRVITALVAVPFLLTLILLAPAWAFGAFVTTTACAGYAEYSNITRKLGHPSFALGFAVTALFVLCFIPLPFLTHASVELRLVSVVVASLIGSSIFALRFPPTKSTAVSLLATVFGSMYLGVLFGTLVGVRYADLDDMGRKWVLFVLWIIMMGDTGAYYVGRALGKHPLAPSLSPKKTIEGLVGGLAASVFAAWGFCQVFTGFPVRELLVLAFVLGIAGVAGDLFESLLKRAASIKDSSRLLPGHGGVLDRFDSILFAAPLLWLYLRWSSP